MKILVFTNMYPYPGRPFYGSFVYDEVAGLRRAGCEVDVLFINGVESKLNYLTAVWQLRAKLRATDYDIIHVHHSYCGFIASMQKHAPIVWTFHEGEITGTREDARREKPSKFLVHSKGLKRYVAGKVDRLIVVAEHLKEALRRDDVVLIPSGIDLALFSPGDGEAARRELGLDTGRRYVLFPSSPDRAEKRFDIARAAVDAMEGGLDVELVWLDNVPHEKVPLYMNAADVLLMTSSFEASPVSIREALACNLPVVSTDVGDVARWIEPVEGCHIVLPDPGEIARVLTAVLASTERVDGRSSVQPYSIDRTAQRVIEVYEDVLSEQRAASNG